MMGRETTIAPAGPEFSATVQPAQSRCQEATMATPPSPLFTYEVELAGDTTTIKGHGRLVGETAPELKQLVKPMIPKCRRIILDLSDVNFVDSSGLGLWLA